MKRNSIQATAFIWHVGLFILLAAGCQSRDSTMEVSVVVDFGPAGRSELQKPVVGSWLSVQRQYHGSIGCG
jgi:hypothetical protein